jgi:uncharacterized protein (DUF2267 family)
MHPNRFYGIVMRTSGIEDRDRAERATAAVLQTLRKRLTFEESEQVAAQLPVALKAVWGQGEGSPREPMRIGLAEFFARVRHEAGLGADAEARWATLGVFAALKDQLSFGEAEDVLAQLPGALKELWAEAQSVGRVA